MTENALTPNFQAKSGFSKDLSCGFEAGSKEIAASISGKNGRDNINVIGQELGVKINLSSTRFNITGPKAGAEKALNLMKALALTIQPGDVVTAETVKEMLANPANQNLDRDRDYLILPGNVRVDPRNERQRQQILGFRNNSTNIITGEAGTGKTWLSVMLAVEAFETGLYPGGIILVRPAVEAGEKLGFMPGDLQSKVDGYMRPLYDALEEVYTESGLKNKMSQKIIEIAAVAFMRGRDIKDTLIILDESQNMTKSQMKLLLTRVGEGSKLITTGDVTQTDLEEGVEPGLADLIARLKHPLAKEMGFLDNTSLVEYLPGDSVRSAAVTRALGLYDIDLDAPVVEQKLEQAPTPALRNTPSPS